VGVKLTVESTSLPFGDTLKLRVDGVIVFSGQFTSFVATLLSGVPASFDVVQKSPGNADVFSNVVTVNAVAATLSLTAPTSQTTTAGRTSTFSATVSSTGGSVAGFVVTFTVSTTPGSAVCQVTTTANGVATCSYTWPESGTFTV
jgi:hypothetical protein